jgi:pSer/pThr/pTyr-binding forkhead associated (FHA) protein/DNA-directed RNA polymerase subunit RPC12/RpoP
MDSLTSGTFVGAGSFRCGRCGYVQRLIGSDTLADCPGCGGRSFMRASLFSAERMPTDRWIEQPGATLAQPAPADHDEHLAGARERIEQPGEYLFYEENHELRTVPLAREWTRIGRSLAADVRLDDPTVSRRHALVVRHPEGVRVLDDRSLNGVFVNDSRVDSKTLEDGDEIIIGRYRLTFISVAAEHGERVGATDPASSSAD